MNINIISSTNSSHTYKVYLKPYIHTHVHHTFSYHNRRRHRGKEPNPGMPLADPCNLRREQAYSYEYQLRMARDNI